MKENSKSITRRSFFERTGAVAAGLTIIPGSVMSGLGHRAPRNMLNIDDIGIGGIGDSRMWTMREPFTLFSEKDGQMVAPRIVKLPCGDLFVTCSRDGDYPFARSRMLRSTDGGSTWREESLHDDFLPVKSPVVLSDNTVRVCGEAVNVKDASPEKHLYFYCDSDDGGRTFSEIRTAYYELSEREKNFSTKPIGKSGYFGGVHLDLIIWRRELLEAAGWHQKDFFKAKLRGPFRGGQRAKVLRLADGNLLSFSSACIIKKKTNPLHREASLLSSLSRDNGLTWEPYSVVAPYEAGDFPYEGGKNAEHLMVWEHLYGEGSGVVLDDGRIYVVMRAGGAGFPIVQTWSADNGKTWTRVKPIDRRVAGVAPTLLKLANGTLAMCHGRPGMFVMFDPSGTGENWQVDDRFDLTDGEALTLTTNARPFVNRPDCYDTVTRIKGLLPELDWVKPEILRSHWYSWENVDMCEVEPGRLFVVYDLQNWIEAPGAAHRNAIRGVRFDDC